jgi:hypothetical protein
MKIDLDRLENIERAVIYIKTHDKRIIVDGKEHVLISANVWESVQKALAEPNTCYVEKLNIVNKGIIDAVREQAARQTSSTKRTDAEGESHDHYNIGTYVLVKTVDGIRVGLVIGNAGVSYSTVALFEQYSVSLNKWLAPYSRQAIPNTMLSTPSIDQLFNPSSMTVEQLGRLTGYNGVKVRISMGNKKESQYGYVVGASKYYSNVATQVYVATLNEPNAAGKVYVASVANLFREDGSPLKLVKSK